MDEIRPFEPQDRSAVREVCRATAYGEGSPAQVIDPWLLTDLMTRYYTDFAPEALWVSTRDGQVVGYLAGCFEERALRRVMLWPIVPAAVAAALTRGLLLRQSFWRLGAALPLWLAANWRAARGAPARDLAGFPVHLHVNLLPEARGHGTGQRLVEVFLTEAKRRALPGVHVTVLAENRPARRFFAKLGFEEIFRLPAFRPPSRYGQLDEKIVYGKAL